jgi:hypothetical protein
LDEYNKVTAGGKVSLETCALRSVGVILLESPVH